VVLLLRLAGAVEPVQAVVLVAERAQGEVPVQVGLARVDPEADRPAALVMVVPAAVRESAWVRPIRLARRVVR
jgi:hypothetical protein